MFVLANFTCCQWLQDEFQMRKLRNREIASSIFPAHRLVVVEQEKKNTLQSALSIKACKS